MRSLALLTPTCVHVSIRSVSGDYQTAMTRFLATRGRDTSPLIVARLLALDPAHVGLERGLVSDEELGALRDALVFCREESVAGQAARACPQPCTSAAPACKDAR